MGDARDMPFGDTHFRKIGRLSPCGGETCATAAAHLLPRHLEPNRPLPTLPARGAASRAELSIPPPPFPDDPPTHLARRGVIPGRDIRRRACQTPNRLVSARTRQPMAHDRAAHRLARAERPTAFPADPRSLHGLPREPQPVARAGVMGRQARVIRVQRPGIDRRWCRGPLTRPSRARQPN